MSANMTLRSIHDDFTFDIRGSIWGILGVSLSSFFLSFLLTVNPRNENYSYGTLGNIYDISRRGCMLNKGDVGLPYSCLERLLGNIISSYSLLSTVI
jgi:hypothetical protein